MRKFAVTAVAAAALLATSGMEASAQTSDTRQLAGVWRNPKNTVHVRIQPCGSNVCGTVAWASRQAIAAARESGTPNLLGTQLFREFRRESEGYWGGRVFVPDMGRTFSGTLRLSGPNAVVARGCLIGRFLCKSQTWVRVG
ncbi:DUF2147 domain-containing protein [Sphingosinicella sp. YJ22]|uniref:DUF2147 domain-containing protein n=1 Tax=Sphingosinicella sp. YJ22 TaxID=1104780 RepID=UPI00140892EF|nr:DUF2147 domain-containing protein [Sphingosinicella sp. YJ22]